MENKDLHNNVYNQSREYFITAINHFRKIMCSTEYTLEQKNTAFEGLFQDYLRCTLTEGDKLHFKAIFDEWGWRRSYEKE